MVPDLKPGDRVRGRITVLKPFGAFVEIENCPWMGLVLIPEISWGRISHPQDAVAVGQTMEFEVTAIVADRHQIGLSIKRCQANPWIAATSQYAVGQAVETIITQLWPAGAVVILKDNPDVEGFIPNAELGDHTVVEGQTVTLYIARLIPERQRMILSFRPAE